MADSQRNTEAFNKLLAALHESQKQQAAIVEEMISLIGGGEPMGDILKRLEASYSDLWKARYKTAYVWAYGKDRPHLKRFSKTIGADKLPAYFLNYLRSDDPFYANRRHPFSLFVHNVNQWAPAGESPAASESESSLEADVRKSKERAAARRG